MKYRLTIHITAESDAPRYWADLAEGSEPASEFDSLEDAVAYLRELADGTNDDTFREYAAQVQREGVAAERALKRWGKKKDVTAQETVDAAREVAAKGDKLKA